MFSKSSIFNLFSSCMPTRNNLENETYAEEAECDAPIEDVPLLEFEQLFIGAEKIKENATFAIDFAHPYYNIVNFINADLMHQLIIFQAGGHWLSTFSVNNIHQNTIDYFLIESFGEKKETTEKAFKKIKKLIASHFQQKDQKTINFYQINTGHQDKQQICGFCILLYVERIAGALKSGEVISSIDELKNILTKTEDGETSQAREQFIVSQSSRFIEIIERGTDNSLKNSA